jgi:GR25 family glycosyltransferase involved in LPS biosynthesis
MKAKVIVIRDNKISETAALNLIESNTLVGNPFQIERFNAATPDDVDSHLRCMGVRWNYPFIGSEIDSNTGLMKKVYPTINPKARIACAMSHFLLWTECVRTNDPILILEHDAAFTCRLAQGVIDSLLAHNRSAIGLNDPMGATRLAGKFDMVVQQAIGDLVLAPLIDRYDVPQGLAGNSAYLLSPTGAERLINLVDKHGLWPNDAIMCRQLVPDLSVTKIYYTKVQGTVSTTSL